MATHQLTILIDKLTNSIEHAASGKSYATEVQPFSISDYKLLGKSLWLFDWKSELLSQERSIYKLIVLNDEKSIHGLISIQDKGDHVYVHLLESSKANRGKKKAYLGIPGNLMAYACKLSFEKGYDGYVSFESKSKLVAHYRKVLSANVLFGNVMIIDTQAAKILVDRYFS
ncbi:hypothetical protein DYBT9623_01246 [Dyadobacter sp. CECT 9623]|uniref:N-acetyltransferase n=1 Tax=Dyadobacter linearis TaxID=2823330 RepID=A0ABM8UM10_9BACT|nr:hypothetical protein [Dyadobacter sp. CECT 9623]CAG5068515.1 hypothetical protein DYBT9623_01246 [Dyadobacter sp. CECT 9623]